MDDVFKIPADEEMCEEYDGMNDNFGAFLIVAKMDLLMRGFSVKIMTNETKINIGVKGLYQLNLNLPLAFDVT